MKNYIPLLFSLVCASTYAADVMEYTVLADIPYYASVNAMLAQQPSGLVTVEVTPTLTYQDILTEAQNSVGRVILMFDNGVLKIPIDPMDPRPIATIYNQIGNTVDATKNRLKNFIDNRFVFILVTQ